MLRPHVPVPPAGVRRDAGAWARVAAACAVVAGCQGRTEPDPPRPPPPAIEARARGGTVARVVASRPCRVEIDGTELMVGTAPLVAQVGATRWSGDRDGATVTLRRDGAPIATLRDTADHSLEILGPSGAALLRLSADGEVATARGEVVRRATAARAGLQVGDATVTGTTDLVLGALLTAPELIPEVRALAACHRLVHREPEARN